MAVKRITKADVAPPTPVRKAEEVRGTFDVLKLDLFTGRFGASWRVRCVQEDGEPFLLLFQANAVRDDEFGAYKAALESNPGSVAGPFTLVERRLANGHSTWEFADADADADTQEPATEPAKGKRGG